MRYTFINGMHFETHKRSKSRKREAYKMREERMKEKKKTTTTAAKQNNNPLSFSFAFATLSRALIRGRQHRNALEIIDMVTARELIT